MLYKTVVTRIKDNITQDEFVSYFNNFFPLLPVKHTACIPKMTVMSRDQKENKPQIKELCYLEVTRNRDQPMLFTLLSCYFIVLSYVRAR